MTIEPQAHVTNYTDSYSALQTATVAKGASYSRCSVVPDAIAKSMLAGKDVFLYGDSSFDDVLPDSFPHNFRYSIKISRYDPITHRTDQEPYGEGNCYDDKCN